MKKFITFALTGILLQGCSSTPTAIDPNKYEKLYGKQKVYALLEKGEDGQYSFTKYSLSRMKNSVNLNTLTHNFPTDESECRAGIGEAPDVLCREDAQFTSSSLDAGDLLKNTLGNVVAASMTMGLATSAYYTVKFDQKEFDESLEAALAKINRKQLIADVNDAVVASQTKLEDAKVKFDALHSKIDTQIKGKIKIQDQSGLFDLQPEVEASVFTDVNTRLNKSLRFNSVKDLTENLNNQVTKAIESSRIGLRCNSIRAYNHDIKGCNQSWGYDSVANIEPITYTISSAKKFILRPQITADDQNLSIKSDEKGIIEITNKTDSFITVSSLSFYMGTDIETLSNLNIELPPGSVNKSLNMSRFGLYSEDNRSLKNATKIDLAQKTNIGVATKYKIVDTNLEKTIYNKSPVKFSQMNGLVSTPKCNMLIQRCS